MINSRSLFDLDPKVQHIAKAHIDACDKEGIDLLITSTWRDIEQQDALYRIGRDPGDIRRRVTNAKGGQSWHQYRCAWDVVPLVGGKCVWDDPLLWKKIVEAGERVGAEAGANWKEFKDLPHFQCRPAAMTLEAALDRFKEKGTIFA